MSLLRPVIRTTAVAALRDKTDASHRVYDSDQQTLTDALMGNKEAQPYIVVYTDTDDRMALNGTPELYAGDKRQLSLTIEIGVARSFVTTKNEKVLQFAATDDGMELLVDVIESQVFAALFGDPQSEWGDLFKRMTYRVSRMTSRRGGQAGHSIRFAARRMNFVCTTIDDLVPGVPPVDGSPIRDFIAMAKSHTDVGISDVGIIIEGLLSPTQSPSWREAQARMGMSREAVEHLNPDGTPLPWPEMEEPPLDNSDDNEFVPGLVDIEVHEINE